MSPNLLMGKQRPREVKPLAQGDATDECRGLMGTRAPWPPACALNHFSLLPQNQDQLSSRYPGRGGQGQRFRQKVRRTAHSPQCQGHSLQHTHPLTGPSPALALFPEPCIPASLNSQCSLRHPTPPARNAFTPLLSLSQYLESSGCPQSCIRCPTPPCKVGILGAGTSLAPDSQGLSYP